jgi:AAHS family 4-hydroxybenzoate transporter-like MFS transporter
MADGAGDASNGGGTLSFQSFVNSCPLSSLQILLFAFCFLIAAIDGFDVALIGFLAPAIAGSLKLTPSALAPVFGAGQLGAVAGALLIGPLADRFGRQRLMIASTVIFGLMTVSTAFVTGVSQLAAMRFLTGIGLGGALPCATALTAEFCPERRRATLTTAMFCGFTLGSAVGGFVTAWAEPLIGWRGVIQWAGIVPLFMVPVLLVAVPESAEYLGRKTANARRLDRVLRRIGRTDHAPVVTFPDRPDKRSSTVTALFASRPLGGIVLLWATSFMTLLAVYLLSSWMPIILTSKGISLRDAALATAMFQIGGTVGAIGLGLLMDRFRPRTVLAAGFALAAVLVVAMGNVTDSIPVLGALIFLAGACLSGGQVGVMAYTAAWYPAHVRATGVAWTNASGRIGSIVGSLAGGALLSLGFGFSAILGMLAVPVIFAACAIARHDGRAISPG